MLIGEQLTMHTTAKFFVGQIIHHIKFDYRGVIFDVDPVFNNTEEWWERSRRWNGPNHVRCRTTLGAGQHEKTHRTPTRP